MTKQNLSKRFWNTARVSELRANEALLFFYLLKECKDVNKPFSISIREACHDLNISSRAFKRMSRSLIGHDLLSFKADDLSRDIEHYCFPNRDAEGRTFFPWPEPQYETFTDLSRQLCDLLCRRGCRLTDCIS